MRCVAGSALVCAIRRLRQALPVLSVGVAVLGGACSSGSSDSGSSSDGSAGNVTPLEGGVLGTDSDGGVGVADSGSVVVGANPDGGVVESDTDAGAGQTGVDGSIVGTGTDASGSPSGMDGGAVGTSEAGKDAPSGAEAGVEAGKDASGAEASSADGSSSSSASPFDCKFAWGEPAPSGSASSYTWLQFMTSWGGYEIADSGSITSFDNGGFLKQLSSTSLIPAYYAYIIGYYGHANGLPDQNTVSATQPNLSTGAAYLLLSDPTGANAPCNSTTTFCADNLVVQAYKYYAQQTYAGWKTKPFVWLIEGDFIQYTDTTTQVASLTSTHGASAALSYAQLGQLAALIASTIKTNMPNAIVAFDDSAWIDDTQRPLYWQAIMQAGTNFDMVWTTGVGNNPPYINAGTDTNKTASYAWLHTNTGKKILVDESAGASQQSDTWSGQSAATINSLIADGVVAVNVTDPPSGYQTNVAALASKLNSTCP